MLSLKRCLVCFMLLAAVRVQSQGREELVMGHSEELYSRILKEKRVVWIHVPSNESPDGEFGPEQYPVIYLLDGWKPSFALLTSIVAQLSGGSGNLAYPKMIVVGIPGVERTRDYTPTRLQRTPAGMDSLEATRSGGGEPFIQFIARELIPHVDSLYPTAPFRILIGHSLGGLLSVYTMMNHTNLFNAYVASDPSMFWDEQVVLKQARQQLPRLDLSKRSLYLATANSMNSGIDTSVIGPIMRCNFQLRDYLQSNPGNHLDVGYKDYPDYDHGTVSLPAMYDALRFIFRNYTYNFPYQFFFDPAYSGDSLLELHYRKLSGMMGYRVSPPEDFINGIAHQLMAMKQFDRAQHYFEMNVNYHPDSYNAFNALAALFERRGNIQKALEYYTRSLRLRDRTETRMKIKNLKGHPHD